MVLTWLGEMMATGELPEMRAGGPVSAQARGGKLAPGLAHLGSAGCPVPTVPKQQSPVLRLSSPFPMCSHPKQKLDRVASRHLYSDPAPNSPGGKRLMGGTQVEVWLGDRHTVLQAVPGNSSPEVTWCAFQNLLLSR